nr:PREDICTED: protein D2-like [Bemisia tabaci]XP_018905891.1 PREDICTED: protein D2-like [Bemisia tabaci]XP_018905892.1 PREDICTED: protein D2-like [Bemisia tabaci]
MPPIPSDSKVLKMSVAEMKKKLQEFRVIPDLIEETPKLPMMVEWVEEEAEFGNYIERYIIKLAPFWVEWKCEKYDFHTVMMLGLDEPSATNPYLRQYQFWIMGNVEGFHVIIGEELTAWIPPRPANGSGPHRYVFLVYLQPQKLDFMEYHLTETDFLDRRGNFSHQAFAKKYNLGKPIASNFFIAEHDPPPPW